MANMYYEYDDMLNFMKGYVESDYLIFYMNFENATAKDLSGYKNTVATIGDSYFAYSSSYSHDYNWNSNWGHCSYRCHAYCKDCYGPGLDECSTC